MEEQKNKVRMVFYIKQEDKDLLNKHCELLQFSPSFFIRNCILEKLNRGIFNTPSRNLDIRKYQLELNSIGNNLNQIAKKLNSNAQFLIADQQMVLDEMNKITKHIVEINSKLN